MSRRTIVALALGIAAAVAIGLACVQVIPALSVGVRASGATITGWAVSPPWSRARTVPLEGSIATDVATPRTKEGSSLTFHVEGDYRLGPRLAPRFAQDIVAGGLASAFEKLAGAAVAEVASRVDVETLVSDPATLDAAVGAALAASGVAVERLSVHSEIADEALLRKRTEEARGRVRPMTANRLLLIGLDGADWQIIEPMVREGRLPHFARLMSEGGWGNLRSYDPMFSPLLWTTIATGKPPAQHGIADFLVRDAATGQRRPISSEFRRCKALWNILGDLQRPSGWIAWWATFPAEPVNGAMVTELLAFTTVRKGPDAAATTPGLASPDDYLAKRKHLLVPPSSVRYEDVRRLFELAPAEFERAQRQAPLEQRDESSKEPPDPVVFAVKLLSASRTYHAVALDMLKSDMPFVSVYFEGIDMMGHRFQHYMPPRMAIAKGADGDRYRDAVTNFYALQDEWIGELLSATGPRTDVVVVSDHGFRNGADRPVGILPFTTDQPAEWHRPWGILAMRGPSIRPGKLPPSSLYDIAPTLLYLAGFPLAADMPGRVVAAAIRPEILAARPPASVRSYELVGEPLARRSAVPSGAASEALDEMMANLRALGYVGGDAGGGKPQTTVTDSVPAKAGGETQVFYHRNLAVALIKQGDLAGAERELLLANERQPFPKTFAMLSEIRARQGRYADAAAILEDGLTRIRDQMEPDSYLWLVETYLLAGRKDAAAAVPTRFASEIPPPVASAISGRLAEADGRLDVARQSYEAALHAQPLLTGVMLRLARLYAAESRHDAIIPYLEAGVAANPKADSYHQMLAERALARGDAREAHRRLELAVEIQPENGLYLGQLATAAIMLGRREEAREHLAWAERWLPTESSAWMAIGSAWDRLGETDRAIAAFDRARASGLEGPGADVGAVLALARGGRAREAHARLDDALRRYPGNEMLSSVARRLGR